MKIFFTIIVLMMQFFVMPAGAQVEDEEGPYNPERAFYRANMYYESGDYAKALEENETILAEGVKSGNLYYNIGNAYFKSGEIGEAMLNYQRALRYMPRDSDLLSNYSYAKSLMKQPDVPPSRFVAFRWMDRALSFITLKQAIMIACALYFIIVLHVIVTKVFKRYTVYSTVIIIVLSAVLIALFIPLVQKVKELREGGIVTAAITDARFEPLEGATSHYALYEGMKVYIIGSKDDWLKVKRPDGKIGWVPKNDVGLIGM